MRSGDSLQNWVTKEAHQKQDTLSKSTVIYCKNVNKLKHGIIRNTSKVFLKLKFFSVNLMKKSLYVYATVTILFGCCSRKFLSKKINYYDINGAVNIDPN